VETVSVATRPRTDTISEKALIQAAQQQDHDAFEHLVRLYDRSVLRVALNILRSEEDARDAYQEAFLRAYKSLNSFRFQCSFHTWLYRIATNVCLDSLRRKSVRKDQWASGEMGDDGPGPLDLASDSRAASNPDQALTRGEMAVRIGDALDLLTPKERNCFRIQALRGCGCGPSVEFGDQQESNEKCLFRAPR
jgi:RNA polymerase sigma-70 factor (ECF subfamily)